ncbi:MAG: M14 family metallopeptidase [Hydrogenophaga sp.]|nr:M14 family metallopeptidase [Hydrogenophaga sp.]
MTTELFSPNYLESRARFVQTTRACGAQLHTYTMPWQGALGEDLAMDVAIHGPADASRVLLTTSAVHGVEGFCGSAIQTGLLQSLLSPPDVAVVHVHAVNPHGFSHARRVNEDNVDLNRNFIDYNQPLPVNSDYAQIHAMLLPEHWPPTPEQFAKLDALTQTWGMRRMQRAITSGQYQFPQGLWFGGFGPTWSHRTFRQVLQDHLTQASEIAWIDLHTGLGPHGHGERIFACNDTGETLQRARQWWGPEITSVDTGTSQSVPLSGPIQMAIYEECPQAQYTGICLEFGTLPLSQMILAMRADHWLALHPEAQTELRHAVRSDMLQAFNPPSPAWQEQVWQQGVQAARQAIHGLALPR